MPPSGRSRYRHAFSARSVSPISEGSWRSPRPKPGGKDFTPAALLAAGLAAEAGCDPCRRDVPLDLKGLVRAGRGGLDLAAVRPVCRRCGKVGRMRFAPAPPPHRI